MEEEAWGDDPFGTADMGAGDDGGFGGMTDLPSVAAVCVPCAVHACLPRCTACCATPNPQAKRR